MADVTQNLGKFSLVPHPLLSPCPTNPRKTFVQEGLAELAESIKNQGIIQPIIARPLPAGDPLHQIVTKQEKDGSTSSPPLYEIVAGERRWRAAKLAKLADVPVVVRDLDDKQVAEIQMVENLQREDLNPMEEAEGYEQLRKKYGYAVEEIAKKVRKSASSIYQSLKLLELGPEGRKALHAGEIDATVALLIARVPGADLQKEALALATKKNYEGDKPSFRAIAETLRDDFMQDLRAAPFPIAEGNLVAGVVACTVCPKRTGNQAELFSDVGSANVCTDTKCFAAKRKAFFDGKVKAAEEKGITVFVGKQAKAILPNSYARTDEYVRLDADVEGKAAGKTVRQLLGKEAPKHVLVQEAGTEKLVQMVARKDVEKLLKEKGGTVPKPYKSTSSHDSPKEKAKREAAAKAEDLEENIRKQIYLASRIALAERIKAVKGLPTVEDVREIALELAGGSNAADFVNEVWGWKADKWNISDSNVEKLPLADLFLFMMDCAMAERIEQTHFSKNTKDPLISLAVRVKVDVSAIRTKLKTEALAAEKASAEAAQVEANKKAGKVPAVGAAMKKAVAKKAVAKKSGKKPNAIFMKPLYISPILAGAIGVQAKPLPRTEIVSKVWAYIKTNKLQDKKNLRNINADEKLQPVFGGKKSVSMFEMTKLIATHLSEADTWASPELYAAAVKTFIPPKTKAKAAKEPLKPVDPWPFPKSADDHLKAAA